jgi:hypothetical protein
MLPTGNRSSNQQMKRIPLSWSIFLLALGSGLSAFASDPVLPLDFLHKRTVIKTNPFALGMERLQFSAEYAFRAKGKYSLQLSGGYVGLNRPFRISDAQSGMAYQRRASGWMLVPEVRRYLLSPGKRPHGFYVGLACRFRSETHRYSDQQPNQRDWSFDASFREQRRSVALAAVGGLQLRFKKVWCLDVFGGFQWKQSAYIVNFDAPGVNAGDRSRKFPSFASRLNRFEARDGLGVRFGCQLGYYF